MTTEPYDEWVINGITPSWISTVDYQYPKLVLHCVAHSATEFLYAQDEIRQFNEFAANTINTKDLGNGGTDLQTSMDGRPVIITNGTDLFKGAVSYPKFKRDSMSSQLIEWDIDITLQIENAALNVQSMIFTPDFRLYNEISLNTWTENIPTEIGGTVSAYPGTVTQTTTLDLINWANIDNIKVDGDGNYAMAYGSGGKTNNLDGLTQTLNASNFGLNIPTDMAVTRVKIIVKYADSSTPIPPGSFLGAYNSTFTCYNKTLTNSASTDPNNLQTLILDTLDGSIGTFSSDPTVYNNSNFSIPIFANFGNYGNIWIDSVQLLVTYAPPSVDYTSDPNAVDGEEIGIMEIVAPKKVTQVQITGSGCNLPATITVNGITQNWHYSHDHNNGDIGEDGQETLSFTVTPPSAVININTSTHLPPHKEGNIWENSASNNSGSKIREIEIFF